MATRDLSHHNERRVHTEARELKGTKEQNTTTGGCIHTHMLFCKSPLFNFQKRTRGLLKNSFPMARVQHQAPLLKSLLMWLCCAGAAAEQTKPGGQMLFSPTKDAIQLVERKHISTLERVLAKIKRPRQMGRITLSLGEGFPLEHVIENARHQFYLDEWGGGGGRRERALSGHVLQRTNIFGNEEGMKKDKETDVCKTHNICCCS